AHGSGSSRHSPRNTFVARQLQAAGLGTLLFDLLTRQEDATYETRFDIALLTRRLEAATRWLHQQPRTRSLTIGYFGASTGAAAALYATATFGKQIGAVVSRGGASRFGDAGTRTGGGPHAVDRWRRRSRGHHAQSPSVRNTAPRETTSDSTGG